MELGIKLRRAADEFSSDFQIAKDRAAPLFLSRQTDTIFVLTAHLKGYKRENIKIDINEDGTSIAISGERQVKETVMVGWKVYKKDTEIKEFKKVFKIPDGVILDQIKANYNEDESTLTITMPKKVKGIKGTSIEEIKEKQELVTKQGSANLQIVDEKNQISGTSHQENNEKSKAKNGDGTGNNMPTENAQTIHDLENGEENQKTVDDIQEISEPKQDMQENNSRVPDEANDIHEEEKEGHFGVESHEEEHKPQEKRFNMCIPIIAGSTLLLSFVVFVFQVIRSKNQTSRRKE
ncbi:hypothetical protein DH2020_035210 [Rehmannia glutinosa]|uniref:SHSP domain-containing protein n=1 Tax=Rehmannia glutinosa TaxID=99300 RepID=A0ABR0V899_REHGL